jgi:hypothetical protein
MFIIALFPFSCYVCGMSITQTVHIHASHRLVIDVPREVPQGPVILTFTPVADPRSDVTAPREIVPSLASLAGIDKGRDTLDEYFQRKRADKVKEDAQIARSLGLDELPKTIKP